MAYSRFVPQSTIDRRMAAKDRRMAAKLRRSVQGVDRGTKVDRDKSGAEDVCASPTPDQQRATFTGGAHRG